MLVNYSDSESESEAPAPVQTTNSKAPKAAFLKSEPGKIRVDLPALKSENGQTENATADGPPAKRARTAGAFGGFNSLLPAPKRTVQSTPKKGVSLKTSSEAAFSRAELSTGSGAQIGENAGSNNGVIDQEQPSQIEIAPEPKLVGKATKFMPLSVSRKKKTLSKKVILTPQPDAGDADATKQERVEPAAPNLGDESKSQPRPRKSLFTIPLEDEPTLITRETDDWKPLTEKPRVAPAEDDTLSKGSLPAVSMSIDPNSLQSIASDLNLTAAQRRQLLGRQGKDARVAHFNMDSEYAANEQLRQAGETAEHRAVKAIAPGKHSLQQLVNNAKSQKDAMEDAWAQGKRNRGEGGSKYGWSAG